MTWQKYNNFKEFFVRYYYDEWMVELLSFFFSFVMCDSIPLFLPWSALILVPGQQMPPTASLFLDEK